MTAVILGLTAGRSDASSDLAVVAAYVDRDPTVDRLVILGQDGPPQEVGLPAGHSRVHGLSLRADGVALAFSASGPQGTSGVFVLNRTSGELRRLGDGAGEVAWAPDSRRLAYVRFDGAVVVDTALGGDSIQLAPGSDPARDVDRVHGCLRWSPDASMLLASYQSFGEGGTGPEGSLDALRIYRSDGSGLRGSVPVSGCGSWSPNEDRIAYVGGDGAVLSATADGEEADVLVPASCGAAVAPEWGTDGVLFHRWIDHSATSEAAARTLDPACVSEKWNGTWIRHDDGSTQLIVPASGCCARWLTGEDGHFSFVTLSQPDDRGNRARHLWLQPASGEPRRLSNDDHDVRSADVLVAMSSPTAREGASRGPETAPGELSSTRVQETQAQPTAPSSPAVPPTTAPPPRMSRPDGRAVKPQLLSPAANEGDDRAQPWGAGTVAGMAAAGVTLAAVRVRRISAGS